MRDWKTRALMFRRLGALMNMPVQGATSEAITLDNIKDNVLNFLLGFAHQKEFIDYFRSHWMRRSTNYLALNFFDLRVFLSKYTLNLQRSMRMLPIPIESYHATLKFIFICGKNV